MDRPYILLNSLKELVLDRFEENKDKVAIVENVEEKLHSITYGKLKEDILSLGTAIYEQLQIRNSKIAVIGENSYYWLVTYFATVCGSNVIVPLDKQLPSQEIINLLKRSNISCIMYSDKKKDVIMEIRSKLPDHVQFVNMDISKSSEQEISLLELLKNGRKSLKKGNFEYVKEPVDPNDFHMLLFTSGTTSNSKGVMLSHKNIINNAYSILCQYGEQAKLTFLSFLPMHHTFEFTISYLCCLYGGGTVAISRGLRYIINDMEQMKPHCLCCVPLLLDNIKRKIEKNIKMQKKENLVSVMKTVTGSLNTVKIDVRRSVFKQILKSFGGNLRFIFCGGAPVDKNTIDVMEGFGFEVLQGYGLTETSPLVAGTPLKNRISGTVGKAIKNVEVRIDLNPNEVENTGEVIVKGPNVMIGYYQDQEATDAILKKGWFYTGDIGYFDKKGNLIISGRSKNVIVTSNGKNIYPEELELLINKIPMVEDSLVYGKGENINDITVTALIKLDGEYLKGKYGENMPEEQELNKILWDEIKKINRKVIAYKAIRELEIKQGDFIKTTTMKIKRNEELKRIKK